MTNRRKQSGAALAIGLILLVVATLVTLAGLQGANLQERMTSNQTSTSAAYMAAELGASDLLAYINEHGWPTNDPMQDEDGAFVSSLSSSDVRGYEFELVGSNGSWASQPLRVFVRGFSQTPGQDRLGEAQIKLTLERDGRWDGDAPAALSCLGGDCNVDPPNNPQNFHVDGSDHALSADADEEDPLPFDERGQLSNSHEDLLTVRPPRPSTYGDSGDVSISGNIGQFCGMERPPANDDDWSRDDFSSNNPDDRQCGDETVWDRDDYENQGLDEAGEPLVGPTRDAYFGADGFFGDLAYGEGAERTVFGDRDAPRVTQLGDGDSFSFAGDSSHAAAGILEITDGYELRNQDFQGNFRFEGAVIVRDCAQVNLGGNMDILGAIVVDVESCDCDATPTPDACEDGEYEPFGGNGAPSVYYSSEALERASGLTGSGVRVGGWRESL